MAWDQLLPLAIMISVVIVLLLFMRRRLEADSRRPERARTLCAELGFNFIAGHDARFRNQGAPAMPMDLAALDRLPASLRSSLIEDSSWRGEGVFGKARIAVYDDVRPTGNRFQTFLVVRGYFRDGPVEPFRIERKGGLALLLSKKPSTGNVPGRGWRGERRSQGTLERCVPEGIRSIVRCIAPSQDRRGGSLLGEEGRASRYSVPNGDDAAGLRRGPRVSRKREMTPRRS
jgi:hypothetical protein